MRRVVLVSTLFVFLSQTAHAGVELSAFVKGVMVGKESAGLDYLSAKKLLGSLKFYGPAEDKASGDRYFPGTLRDYSKVYSGSVDIDVNGRRYMAETMDNERQNWTGYVAGPNASASTIYLRGDQVTSPAGIGYFRKAGFSVTPIACEILDGGNNTGFYLVETAGKRPAILEIAKSTGSGGVWVRYGIHLGGLKAKDLPAESEIGVCAIKD